VVHSDPFSIIDVSAWEVVATETSGAEAKDWLRHPVSGLHWLFKSVTIKGGHVHGEDWAEKAVAEVAGLLGVPCAVIEMAERRTAAGGVNGVISQNLRPSSDYQLQPGQVLLEDRRIPGYQHRSGGQSHPGHTLENIQTALEGALPPPGCELPFSATAFDVFAGFILFDAWIANRDRHDNNWSILLPRIMSGPAMRLCGSYDHGSSLGFNLTDAERLRRLAEGTVEQWCRKGTAWRFGYKPTLTLVDLAVRALSLAAPDARTYWPQRLHQVNASDVASVLERVPRMSEAARTFASSVLAANRRRVLDACR
jgi:hypothetical protein